MKRLMIIVPAFFTALMMVSIVFTGAGAAQPGPVPAASAGAPTGQGAKEPLSGPPALSTVTFPAGTIVIPMDDKQADIVQSFGFAHALLRNNTFLLRIIEPPNATIKTISYPAGEVYRGGPIFVMNSSAADFSAVKASFPSVSVDYVSELFTSDKIFIVKRPTRIIMNVASHGRTSELLDEMKIPYALHNASSLLGNPGIIMDYNMFIDDCTGLGQGAVTPAFASTVRNFTASGNEAIFTCWAHRDMNTIFPGYTSGGISQLPFSRQSNISAKPDFPAQYWGPGSVTFEQVWTKVQHVYANATVISRGNIYDDAFYYYFGKGIVEFFSFHPGDQSDPSARQAAITLYGNKFLHIAPIDSGCSLTSSSSPKTIATNGTSTPKSCQSTVTLTVKPVDMLVFAETKMAVNYRLHSYIDYLPGSFCNSSGATRAPSSITSYPDGTTGLKWDVPTLPQDSVWDVKFNITCSQAGTDLPVNDRNLSKVTYIDETSTVATRYFVELKINAVDGLVVPEPQLAAAVCASCLAACAVASGIRLRKRRQ